MKKNHLCFNKYKNQSNDVQCPEDCFCSPRARTWSSISPRSRLPAWLFRLARLPIARLNDMVR